MFALTIAFVIHRISQSAPREEKERETERGRKIVSRIDKGSKWIAWPIYRSREKTDGYRDSGSSQSREGDSTRSNNFQGGSFRRKVRACTIRSKRDRFAAPSIPGRYAVLNRRDGWRLICGLSADTQRDASGSETDRGASFRSMITEMSRNSIQCSFTLFHAFLIMLITRVTHIRANMFHNKFCSYINGSACARVQGALVYTRFKFYNYFKYFTVIEPRGIRKFKS